MNGTTNTNIGKIRRAHLAKSRLYVLCDGAHDVDRFANLISQLSTSGVDVIQLRDKRLSEPELCERITVAIQVLSTVDKPPLLILNDSPALAAQFDVDGVHIGQEDGRPMKSRDEIGPDKLLGISTHSPAQATKAVADGADYLGAGPTFPSTTKSFETFAGLEFLNQVANVKIPVFAIGGIAVQNVEEVLATGITRIAVSNAIVGANNIALAARELNAKLR